MVNSRKRKNKGIKLTTWKLLEKQEKEMVVQEEDEKEDIVEEMVVQAEEEKDKEVKRDEEEKMVGEMVGAAVERLCADRGGLVSCPTR